ncbi:hypothetical protein Droror1_Dr00021509 [Drosera rotundifolia]
MASRKPLLLVSSTLKGTPTRTIKFGNFTTLENARQEQGEADEVVRRISNLLKHSNWKPLIESSDIPYKLTPHLVGSVLRHNRTSSDPTRLLGFFYWCDSRLGLRQHLQFHSLLALLLCHARCFPQASGLVQRLIESRRLPLDLLESLVGAAKELGLDPHDRVAVSSAVFDMVINAYKKLGLLNEASSLLLFVEDGVFLPSLICCNSLLTDFLRSDMMGLFHRVYYKMLELKIGPDVYTYTILIKALCKAGKVEEANRLLSEMGEKGCSPNVVTYNIVIDGLCRVGALDEAMELKQSMAGRGLALDSYTFTTLVNGFCRLGRTEEGKWL